MGAVSMEIRPGEEWYFGNYDDCMECVIDFGDGATAVMAGKDREHARRIVASVNATAGISVEVLEAGCIAELVEALEGLWTKVIVGTDAERHAALERAWATLAKVKGEGE